MPYLTPDTLAGDCFLLVRLPDDRNARIAVLGQLTDLGNPAFWETYGTASADDTAAEMETRFADLRFYCFTPHLYASVLSVWALQSMIALYDVFDSSNVIAFYNPASPDESISINQAGLASLVTIDSAGTNTQQIGYSSGLQLWISQGFQVTEGYLSQFKVNFSTNVGTPSGDMVWEVRSDNGGSPSATILDTGSFTPTPNAENTVNISNGVYLASSTAYWFVLRCASNQTSGNAYRVRVTVSNPYANGVIKITTDGGSSWALNGAGSTDVRMTITTISQHEIEKIAQPFFGNVNETLDLVRFTLRRVGSPSGNLTVKLVADDNGEPDSTPLATSDPISTASVGTSYDWVSFPFDTPYALEASKYWLVLESTHTPDNANYIEVQTHSD